MFNVMRAALSAHNVGVSLAPEQYAALPVLHAPRDLLEFATIAGAKASGLADRTGSLTVGKDADLIVFRLDQFTTIPSADIAASIVGRRAPRQRRDRPGRQARPRSGTAR